MEWVLKNYKKVCEKYSKYYYLHDNRKFDCKTHPHNNYLQIFLETNNVQTRTIFTGNILRQPIMKKRFYKKCKNSYNNSDFIMKNGMLIGCHHGLSFKDIDYMLSKFDNFFKKNNLQ